MLSPGSRRLLSSLLIFLLVPLCPKARAQGSKNTAPLPDSAYKLISVEVTGSQRFTSADVAAASGLPVGTVAHEEDFKKAARQLGESGAFSDISYKFSYSAAGTKLEFQVTDADKFVPARFSDFVWFTDDELRQKVHQRVPLFNGDLPVSGRLPDEVSDVLQAMLVERGIPGIVEFARNAPSAPRTANDQPESAEQVQSIDYNVTGVSIRIHRAEFPGAGAAELPLLQAAAERLTGREYSRAYMSSFVERSVLPIFREHGYLKATCGVAQPKVVTVATSEPSEHTQPPTYVEVTFPVTPGIAYKLTGVEWSGNKEFSSDALQPLLHAKLGQPADTMRLDDDLRAVQELYGSRGYVTTAIKANAAFDDAAGTVAYHLEVTEGAVYRMGELEFRGIDNNLTARLRAAWKLRPGDVYDASYLKDYLPLARKLLPPNLDWEVSTHVTAISRDRTVDVDLQYVAKAPQ